MYATDFEYDGRWLSDYNCIVCNFEDSSGTKVASAGSSITFNKITRDYGKKNSLSGIQYDQCITATFDICKNPEVIDNENLPFTSDECRDIMRWLNRGKFYKFRVLYDDADIDTFFFNASFNIEKIKIAEQVYGFRLTMETDKPYAYGETEKYTFDIKRTHLLKTFNVKDVSDDVGDTYPNFEITCSASGDLTITNTTMGISTYIKNCTMGEVIKIDGENMIIETSLSRNIFDDFNFVFPQITNSLDNISNGFTFSLPCVVTITYDPIIKETF